MALSTRIVRSGGALPLNWGCFHVAAMIIASSMDSGEGPFKVNSPQAIAPGWKPGDTEGILIKHEHAHSIFYRCMFGFPGKLGTSGSYTLRGDYCFVDEDDGEVLELKKGDTLIMHG